MTSIRKLSVLAGLVGASLAGAVSAQTTPYEPYNNPSWYIAPGFDLMVPDHQFDVNKNGRGANLRFGKQISPSWDVQFGPSYARSKASGNKYSQTGLSVDGLYMFSRDQFKPFLLGSIGLERDKNQHATPSLNGSETTAYLGAGLGFQYAFTDQWSLQADLRRLRSFNVGSPFPFTRANTTHLNLGLAYFFDKVAPPPAPKPVAAYVPPPAPVAPPPPPPPPAPKFERITLSASELFAFDKDTLASPQPKLDEIAAVLKSNPQVSGLVINGYTDRLGSDKYNLKLSQRRADTVKAYLVNSGVDANKLTAVGKGKANPVVECNNKKRADLIKCLEPNRRIEVEQFTVERRVK